ncbi:hypothetical protein BT93_E0290 [Corymbia citriodora subsp. variegata]|nr:hypothetical protein BT93_E0290 [Corymbia citriodora subsp. variegata]
MLLAVFLIFRQLEHIVLVHYGEVKEDEAMIEFIGLGAAPGVVDDPRPPTCPGGQTALIRLKVEGFRELPDMWMKQLFIGFLNI